MQTTLTGKPAPTTNVAQHAGEKRSAPANPKINAPKKKVVEQRIDTMLDKGINFKGHAPKNISEVYALGQALKLLNIGATRAISSQTTLEQYKSSVSCVREWHEIAMKQLKAKMKPPPTVRLNDHNINDGYRVLLQVL